MPMTFAAWSSSAFLFAAVALLLQRAWSSPRDMSATVIIPEWIAFGDSITQFAWREGGYGAELQNRYQRKLDVVQRGFSGYNTDWALLLAPQILPLKPLKPLKVLSVFFGANDAVNAGGNQHVPLDRYKANLKKLVDLIHHPSSGHYSPETEIFFIGISPVCLGLPTRTRERTASYARASLDVVSELRQLGNKHVWHVETHDALLAEAGVLDSADPEKALWQLLEDGLHLSANGYRVVSARLWETITRETPHLLPERLPGFAPDWGFVQSLDIAEVVCFIERRSIDPADPGKALRDIRHRGLVRGVAAGKG